MKKGHAMKVDYEKGGLQKDVYEKSEVVDVPCPLCGNGEHKEIYKEREVLGIAQCKGCSLIYVTPRLKNPEGVYWGDAERYLKEAKLIFEGKASHHRDSNYRDDLRLIHKYKPTGNFLDIGTNMGFFLRNAKKWSEWKLYGVEPSPSLSEMARKYFGLNIKTSFLENAGFESEFFDVVTMTDVFEHIPEPGRILNDVHRILKPDGILFIKVPNGLFNMFKFYIAKLTGRLSHYDIFDSYEHVVHYSDWTLKQMLKKCGFKVIKVTIGKPIHIPLWHNYLGQYYQYPIPWSLDPIRQSFRFISYLLSHVEFWLRFHRVGYLAPNIIVIAKKA